MPSFAQMGLMMTDGNLRNKLESLLCVRGGTDHNSFYHVDRLCVSEEGLITIDVVFGLGGVASVGSQRVLCVMIPGLSIRVSERGTVLVIQPGVLRRVASRQNQVSFFCYHCVSDQWIYVSACCEPRKWLITLDTVARSILLFVVI